MKHHVIHVCVSVIDSCQWSMGTTASAAPQPTLHESFHGNGMTDSRRSASSASFQTLNIHNNKGKSIITNKVAPVVITYVQQRHCSECVELNISHLIESVCVFTGITADRSFRSMMTFSEQTIKLGGSRTTCLSTIWSR